MRPTESFTLFLQQIGRGLRRHPGKSFVSILDFIGNYRNSFIPYLALRGMTSLPAKIEPKLVAEKPQIPSLCFVEEDREVVKLQREELRKLVDPVAYLSHLYRKKREAIDDSPSLTDFLLDPEMADPRDFTAAFGGNWLRVKEAMDDLTPFEQSLIDGPGELLLKHIEDQLKPNKSYKMVVLSILARWNADDAGWPVDDIAREFLSFYLSNRHYLSDYPALSRQEHPATYPLSRVRSHILQMPLKYLSDKPDKFFILEKKALRFYLRNDGPCSGLPDLWNDPRFKVQLQDRINYALKRYFFRDPSQGSHIPQIGKTAKTDRTGGSGP